jgi:2-dehydropantoate 2-reductase
MGGTVGAALVAAGHAVRFVDRDRDHVDAMRRAGLRVEGPVVRCSVDVDATTPDEVSGSHETILLCVKAHHTEHAVRDLEPFLAPDGAVVSIQNGLNEAVIAERVGAERTIGAFVNFGADLVAPGVVHWGGRGAVVMGELDGRITDRLRTLHAVLLDFEPGATMTANVFGYLWSKLAYGALLFATALTDESIADSLDDPGFRPLYVAIAKEVCRVANAAGIRLETFDGFDPAAFSSGACADDASRSLDELVTFNRRSAKTHSGIWRDLAVRRRKTEVDAQLGAVAREARRLGLQTPLVQGVIDQIHEIEGGTRAQVRGNLDELLDLVLLESPSGDVL